MDIQAVKAVSQNLQSGKQADPRTPAKSRVETTDSSDDEDDNGNEDDELIRPNPRGRKRKSILQPRGSKFSKKAAYHRSSLRIAETHDDDNEDQDEIIENVSPLATAASNRNKRQAPPDQDPSVEGYHEYLPQPYIEVKLVHQELPTTFPQGPNDDWSRYHGSSKERKEEFKQPFQEHAATAKEKIDLVMNERRPYLPVK